MQTLETHIAAIAANVATVRRAAENAQNEAVYEEFNPVEIPLQATENAQNVYTPEIYMPLQTRAELDAWRRDHPCGDATLRAALIFEDALHPWKEEEKFEEYMRYWLPLYPCVLKLWQDLKNSRRRGAGPQLQRLEALLVDLARNEEWKSEHRPANPPVSKQG